MKKLKKIRIYLAGIIVIAAALTFNACAGSSSTDTRPLVTFTGSST